MILVNTTFVVDKRLINRFMSMLKATWWQAVTDGGMKESLILRILHDEEPETARCAVQFQAGTKREYEEWLDATGAQSLNALMAAFPRGSVVHFTTLMGILSRGGADDNE